jgi:redox-sensitive bicupin YhaK (pirin superfamily)
MNVLNREPAAKVARIVLARSTIEGEGMQVRRALPAPRLEAVGPFIFLDHFGPVTFGPGEARGAPDHPHRGFETLTYLLEGRGEHRDSLGNHSVIGPGEAQWMRAGSGILHDEGADEALRRNGGRIHGLQFWINLPRGTKMSPPAYRHVGRESIPVIQVGDATLRLLAGTLGDWEGPVESFARPWLAHVLLPAGGIVEILLKAAEFGVYVAEGSLRIDDDVRAVESGQLAVLTAGNRLLLRAETDTHAFVLGGDPLDAPILRYGPFVMNTEVEVREAIQDFHAGRFGRIPAVPSASRAAHVKAEGAS